MAESESGIQALLTRAKLAIAEAKRLSSTFAQTESATSTNIQDDRDGAALCGASDPSTAPDRPTPSETQPDELPGPSSSAAVAAGVSGVSSGVQVSQLLCFATRLAVLQEQQAKTLQQLLALRLQQLKLRQQQLNALQGLLFSELQSSSSGFDNHADAAVSQALALLQESLLDVTLTVKVLQQGNVPVTLRLIGTVTEADSRAEDVSGIARHLLALLRRQTAASTGGGDRPPGATPQQLATLPTFERRCSATGAEAAADVDGDPDAVCPICLGALSPGEHLSSLACGHQHHQACLWEWLSLSACCPICKLLLPAAPDVGQALQSRTGAAAADVTHADARAQ